MSPILALVLVALNLGLIFLLFAWPFGHRTIRMSRSVVASRTRVWNALWPFGTDAGWSGQRLGVERLDEPGLARLRLGWSGRDDRPIEHVVRLEDVTEGERYTLRVVDDSSLHPNFWRHYREDVELAGNDGDVRVTITRADWYRGAAFLIFRYFAMRREIGKLKTWAETGRYREGGLFEHPASQFGFAALSVLVMWPVFGLTVGGFILACVLTAVVALHELGHMAAFRMMGHRKVRMIFLPLLGGIAIGGRPYDSRFEVAFVALMGAGFSAFLVPLAIAACVYSVGEGWRFAASIFATLAGIMALFNIANLVPVWKFDGGQMLRQICPGPLTLAFASFVLLLSLLAVGHAAGFPGSLLVVTGAVFAILSLITAGTGVKARRELRPLGGAERGALACALVAVFVIHATGVLWASARLSDWKEFEERHQKRNEAIVLLLR